MSTTTVLMRRAAFLVAAPIMESRRRWWRVPMDYFWRFGYSRWFSHTPATTAKNGKP